MAILRKLIIMALLLLGMIACLTFEAAVLRRPYILHTFASVLVAGSCRLQADLKPGGLRGESVCHNRCRCIQPTSIVVERH
jgi:hypothetical protein